MDVFEHGFPGAPLATDPFVGIVNVGHILAQDIPFVSLLRMPSGGLFVRLFIQHRKVQPHACVRWMMVPVAESNLLLYIRGKRSLRELVLDPPGGVVFIEDTENGEAVRQGEVSPWALDEAYLPSAESFLDRSSPGDVAPWELDEEAVLQAIGGEQ